MAAFSDLARLVCKFDRFPEARAFCAFGAPVKVAHEQRLCDSWLADLFDASMLSELMRANAADHFFMYILHHPFGLTVPSTVLHDDGGSKTRQFAQLCSPFGVSW